MSVTCVSHRLLTQKFWSPFGSVWLKHSGDGSILGPDRLLFQVLQAWFTLPSVNTWDLRPDWVLHFLFVWGFWLVHTVMLLDLHRHLLSWNALTHIFPWAELFLQMVNEQIVMSTVLFTFLHCVNYVLPFFFFYWQPVEQIFPDLRGESFESVHKSAWWAFHEGGKKKTCLLKNCPRTCGQDHR